MRVWGVPLGTEGTQSRGSRLSPMVSPYSCNTKYSLQNGLVPPSLPPYAAACVGPASDSLFVSESQNPEHCFCFATVRHSLSCGNAIVHSRSGAQVYERAEEPQRHRCLPLCSMSAKGDA